MNRKQYLNMTTEGTLFPLWIMENFKNFKLPEILKSDDPCNVIDTVDRDKFKLYQTFLAKYLDYNSIFKTILIYHGLGSGKTASAINIYNMLYNYNPNWNVFILIRATLKDEPWISNLKKWLSNDNKEKRLTSIKFISYDSPLADKQFIDVIRTSDITKKSLFIIDEVHNFISNVYSNYINQHGRRAITIYETIQQTLKSDQDTRILLLSGTPIINYPFELALLFNLLKPNLFPTSEAEFNNYFVNDNAIYPMINEKYKNTFQRRILGLVSYYVGSTPDVFAKKQIHNINIEMSKYQKEVYNFYEEKENVSRGIRKYKTFTRQACNFVFPIMDEGYMGVSRPRPNSKLAMNIEKGKEIDNNELEKNKDAKEYVNQVNNFIEKFKKYMDNKKDSMDYDIDNYINSNLDFNEFIQNIKSNLLMNLYLCSPKMTALCLNVLKSSGPVLIYSNYVLVEGLKILTIYMNYFGINKYVEYHGGISKIERKKNLDKFNQPENIDGSIVKAILISAAGTEGLNLINTMQVHILEPYWHEVRIEQVIGRALRQCSHKALPIDKRIVDIFRYKIIRTEGKHTTDEFVDNISKNKNNLVQSFLEAIKEAAIDCNLFINHNKLASDIKCFKFSENLYFNPMEIYKPQIKNDIKSNYGSNSNIVKVKRIITHKISAVMLLANNKYSKINNYYYYKENGNVYDYDNHYLIGNISKNIDGTVNKLNDNVYIIDKVITIPQLLQ